MPAQVSTRGQITIDREARSALDVRPGMVAVQVVAGDHLEVYFVPARHDRSLFGSLRAQHSLKGKSWDDLEERAARSIAAEA